MKEKKETILVIGGHDPTGGAGIQADIETITSFNCHAVTLITCLTSQNTSEFKSSYSINKRVFQSQAEFLLKDIKAKVVKIGALGNGLVEPIISILNEVGDIPIVYDPVVFTSSGGQMSSQKTQSKSKELLLKRTKLITPNLAEIYQLTKSDSLEQAIKLFVKYGCSYILCKDLKPESRLIVNRLYKKNELINEWEINRIDGSFHGTGCNLSSAIASNIAKGIEMKVAIDEAIDFVNRKITNSLNIGKGSNILKA